MSDSQGDGQTVLVVDDEPEMVEMFAMFLEECYDVRRAVGGSEGLERMDDTVDLVLLDRQMPELDGDDVLTELRARGFDVPVAMVTAVEPDLDIVDLPFDDYVVKPVRQDGLLSKVEVLANRAKFDDVSREFYRLAVKKSTLEGRESIDHTTSEEYHAVVDRMNELRTDLDETLADLLEEDVDGLHEDS